MFKCWFEKSETTMSDTTSNFGKNKVLSLKGKPEPLDKAFLTEEVSRL